MPITIKNLPGILQSASQAGSSAFAQGAENARADQVDKLKRYLRAQKEGSIDPQGKYTAGTDVVGAGYKADQNLQRLEGMKDKGLVQEGGGALVGADGQVSFSRGVNAAAQSTREANQRSRQAAALAGYVKNNIKPYEDQLDTLNLYHQMLDNPNSIDQKKLQVLSARMVEGPGQRLLESVIQAMPGGNSLQGTAQDKWNWWLGQAKAGFTPEQINAMRDSSFKMFGELGPRYDDARNKYKVYADQIANLIDPAARQNLMNSDLAASSRMYDDLNERYKTYLDAAKGRTTLQNPLPPYREPKSVLERLQMVFGSQQPKVQQTPPPPTTTILPGLTPEALAAEAARRKKAKDGSQ